MIKRTIKVAFALGVLFTVQSQGSAQTNSNEDEIWAMLREQGVSRGDNRLNYCGPTRQGNFVCVQLYGREDGGFVTLSFKSFLEERGTLKTIHALDSWKVYGYSALRNVLLVGRFSRQSMTDPGIETIYLYHLKSEKFSQVYQNRRGVYHARIKDDSVSYYINVKMPNGIGSELQWISRPLP